MNRFTLHTVLKGTALILHVKVSLVVMKSTSLPLTTLKSHTALEEL